MLLLKSRLMTSFLFDISTWLSDEHPRITVSKTELLIFSPLLPNIFYSHFPQGTYWHTTLFYDSVLFFTQTRNHCLLSFSHIPTFNPIETSSLKFYIQNHTFSYFLSLNHNHCFSGLLQLISNSSLYFPLCPSTVYFSTRTRVITLKCSHVIPLLCSEPCGLLHSIQNKIQSS